MIMTSMSGCMLGYLVKSSYHQMRILKARVDIDHYLQDVHFPEEKKQKLRLVQEAKRFAEKQLHLKPTDNYSTYVQLDRDYVTWIVRASPKYKLESHYWNFPIIGRMPYKGYFTKDEAIKEAATFSKDQFDTYVRGATAYSTLGWFKDPILSPMLNYSDYELVNLIIHETVHATVFIDNAVEFNERLATFIGNLGADQFFIAKEGPNGETLKRIKNFRHDQKIFQKFITAELTHLEQWYIDNQNIMSPDLKSDRLDQIQQRFATDVLPTMKTQSFTYFKNEQLNNAQLMSMRTYIYSLDDFHQAYQKLSNDFAQFLQYCKSLAKTDDPEKTLKEFVQSS